MAHARTQIREAIKNRLFPISAFNGHVFTSRFSNLQHAELPSVNIFCLQETSTPLDISGLSVERTLSVGLSIKTQESSDMDLVLDELADLVEVAIESDTSLGGLVGNMVLTATQIQINEDAAQAVGEALLQYQVTYFTQANNPAITL